MAGAAGAAGCRDSAGRRRCESDGAPGLAFVAIHALGGPTGPRILLLALSLLMARSLAADDLQSWSEVELQVLETGRVEWTVGGVARIRNSLGSLYDRRAATEANVVLTDRFSVTFGYVLRNRTRSGFGFRSDHRLLAGLTYPILQRAVAVKGTTLYERHVGRPDVPDFNRYRQQFEVEHPSARVSPWLYQSLAFKREGFVRSRSRLGFRWNFASGHSLKGAYQFESIKSAAAWRPRHAIYTEWSFALAAKEKASQ